MTVLVLSANLGGYDAIKQAPRGPGVRAILYTDAGSHAEARRMGWQPRERRNPNLTPRYLAKAPKCAPHLLGHAEDDILWIDASMEWRGRSVKEMFDMVPVGGVGCYRHRMRSSIQDEAAFSAPLKLYREEPVLAQAAQYTASRAAGLYEAGILVWRGAQRTLGIRWAAEILSWSDQDQLSLPHAAREVGVTITTLVPGSVVDNPWFRYVGHKRNDYQ